MLILILTISVFFMFFFIDYHSSFAIEISKNSAISDDMMAKISNLTKEKDKIAFLTFDDGPNISVTPKVLDIL